MNAAKPDRHRHFASGFDGALRLGASWLGLRWRRALNATADEHGSHAEHAESE